MMVSHWLQSAAILLPSIGAWYLLWPQATFTRSVPYWPLHLVGVALLLLGWNALEMPLAQGFAAMLMAGTWTLPWPFRRRGLLISGLLMLYSFGVQCIFSLFQNENLPFWNVHLLVLAIGLMLSLKEYVMKIRAALYLLLHVALLFLLVGGC